MRRKTSKGLPNQRLHDARGANNWSQKDVANQIGTTTNNVSRWELGQTLPGPYFRAKLCTLFGKNAAELGLLPGPGDQPQAIAEGNPAGASVGAFASSRLPEAPDFWKVPYARNLFFTGREELLHVLYARLCRERTVALTHSWAISGLGGIGKTQVALEYAYRYGHHYTAILWAGAATPEALLSGFVAIADVLQLPERHEQDQNRVIQAVKGWLASHQQWLLILDNADDIAIVPDFLPTKRAGHLLLTTRAQALGTLAQQIEMETMGVAEGTLFLLRRAKLLAPDATLDQASESDLAGAEAIAFEMDFLPLALDQAGAYIEEVGCSLSTYLDLYQTHRKELLGRRGHAPTHHPEPVATTWSLNFQHIEQTCPAAAHLLCLCAFLEPDAIPEELISEGGAFGGPILQGVATDPLLFNEAIEELRKFSLVQRDPENRLLRVHRLVQAVLRESIEPEERQRWAERVVLATSALFPQTVEATTWTRCQRYLPQAQVCCTLIQEYALAHEDAASLLFRTANYLYDYALYEQAEPLFLRTLDIREQVLGQHHLDVARTLNNLARLYCMQGKIERAEPLFQRALQIMEQSVGPGHPDVALLLNNLANISCMQGKYAQAEPLYLRSLSIREQTFGPNHREVAQPLNNLANLYYDQEKYERVEPLYLRALQIWEQALGPAHPDVSHPLHGLANLYRDQRKYEEADLLYQRALNIRQQFVGKEHPATADVLYDFAVSQEAQGNSEEAVSLYQQALTIREHVFGTQHPITRNTRERVGKGL